MHSHHFPLKVDPRTQPTFRPISEANLVDLVSLASSSFRATYRGIHETAEIEEYISTNFTIPQLQSLSTDPNSVLLGGFLGTKLFGYSLLSHSIPPSCVENGHSIELVRLYLDTHFIGRGLGTTLLNATLEEASRLNKQTAWLDVYDRNVRAVEFYTKRGFSLVGHKEYWFGGKPYLDPVYLIAL